MSPQFSSPGVRGAPHLPNLGQPQAPSPPVLESEELPTYLTWDSHKPPVLHSMEPAVHGTSKQVIRVWAWQ